MPFILSSIQPSRADITLLFHILKQKKKQHFFFKSNGMDRIPCTVCKINWISKYHWVGFWTEHRRMVELGPIHLNTLLEFEPLSLRTEYSMLFLHMFCVQTNQSLVCRPYDEIIGSSIHRSIRICIILYFFSHPCCCFAPKSFGVAEVACVHCVGDIEIYLARQMQTFDLCYGNEQSN